MMKKIFQYLRTASAKHETTAVTYDSFCTNSHAVYHCYYDYDNPVKGYTFLYYHRALIRCYPNKGAVNSIYNIRSGYKFQ